jgi:hypothetical protein
LTRGVLHILVYTFYIVLSDLGQGQSLIRIIEGAIPKIFRGAGIKKLGRTACGVGIHKSIAIVSLSWAILLLEFSTQYHSEDGDNYNNHTLVHLLSVNIFLSRDFKMTLAVLIKEQFGNLCEIEIDIAPKKNEIFLILGGAPTFIGQWPDLDVVLMKAQYAPEPNQNILPPPFDTEDVRGVVLLMRMDENSDPRDFTLKEYLDFVRGHERVTA